MQFQSSLVCVVLIVLAVASADEFYNIKRTPLGTMRFGKRASALEDYLLSEQLYGEEQKRAGEETAERSIRAPLGTMRFGKRAQLAPFNYARPSDLASEYMMNNGH